MSFTLYINTADKVTELTLPAINNKLFSIDISETIPDTSIELEVFDGVWKIISTDKLVIKSGDKRVGAFELSDGAVINMYPPKGEEIAVMVKDISPENNVFGKYDLSGKKNVTVGRTDDNDIVIRNEFVGSHHCTLSFEGGCTLTDNSKNGTFLNGKRINSSAALKYFDSIYIMGYKIIYLGKVLAVCEGEKITVKLPDAGLDEYKNKNIREDDSFLSRAPRRIEPLDTEPVEIDDPPAKQRDRKQPLIFMIGPSITMPIPILVSTMLNISLNSGSGRTGSMYIGTFVSVLLSAFIGTGWTLAHRIYNQKQLASDEKERIEAYSKYIENNRKLLEEKHCKSKTILDRNYLFTEQLSKNATEHKELFWNRNIYQSDFLTIRLGSGKIKLPSEIIVSKKKFSVSDDELCKFPRELKEKYEKIDGCVSLITLIKHKIIGMVGNSEKLGMIVNNILCQTAALHCYTDVKICILAENTDVNRYSWAKWLPHSFMRGSEARLVGFDDNSRESVIYEVASELRRRAEMSKENNKQGILLPHIILVCTSSQILRNSVLSRYMSSPVYYGITFLLVYGGINMLPNECKAIIECSEDYSGSYMLDGEITEENNIDFETVSASEAEAFARNISGYYVDEVRTGSIPQSVDFLEMLKIGRLEHWELIRRYKSNRSYEGIKSFIGSSQGGNKVFLDIHDKKDGPHGLVAGTTGSGKSETLQTFILSLAMSYSPDDVAFVLIDYKGGGMANVFAGLPHIAGMITNLSDEAGNELDRSLTRRACSSLKSEIKRRQTVFGNYKINHIDSYAKLFIEGKAAEPMPHLIIISDEFAELKKEQPEFIKELISVARVGRSLGIHLILATQKPSGVVDDEIWSNSRFRICLRVQDKQDSTGMIKRPDAAYITEAGRAFLQIGNDERFEEFQSGYSGGEYIPKESVVSSEDNEVTMIEIDGSPTVVHEREKGGTDSVTELDAAVKYICAETDKYRLAPARSLWLPPLGRFIYLEDIDKDCPGITAVYGMVDNYEQQKQYPCKIDFLEASNIKICGTAGTGKTTLLQTLICSAASKYPPEKFNFYIMDFSSRTFKLFKKLPHCGGVVYEEDTEAVGRLIKLISDIIEERKKLFEKEDIGSYKEYIKLRSLPLIVLAIDNFGSFTGIYEGYEETMLKLLHDSVRYGIQVVVTVNNTAEIKYKMRSYLLTSVALRMAEKGEYTEFVGKNPEFVPVAVSGRGLIGTAGSVHEYQTALPVKGRSEAERAENLKKLFAEISVKYEENTHAKIIPVISADVKYSELLENDDYSDSLLIGYDYEAIRPYSADLSSFFCYAVSDNGYDGISLFFNDLSLYCEKYRVTVKAVKLNAEVKAVYPSNAEIITDSDGIGDLLAYLHKEFTERNKAIPAWNSDSKGITRDRFMAEKFGRIFIIIDDMVKFCDIIHAANNSNYAELADVFFKNGRNHGIHFFGGYNSSRKTYLPASNSFKSENHGVHLGGKADNQNVLEINLPLPAKVKQTNSNIGFAVEDKKVLTVYLPGRE